MHSITQETEILEKYLPPYAYPLIQLLLEKHLVKIKITRGRITKFGDFHPKPKKGTCPEIRINNNLNPFSFLITLLHEVAHFMVWNGGHFYSKPHGRLWKQHFINLMNVQITGRIFPVELLPVINKHLKNPKATSCSDAGLYKKLSQYDTDKPGIYIDDLPDNAIFETASGEKFEKIRKIKTRSLCKQIISGKKYLFNPVCRVIPVNDK